MSSTPEFTVAVTTTFKGFTKTFKELRVGQWFMFNEQEIPFISHINTLNKTTRFSCPRDSVLVNMHRIKLSDNTYSLAAFPDDVRTIDNIQKNVIILTSFAETKTC